MKTSPTLLQRLGMCWLMLALLLSPAIGLMHQVVHASGAASPTSQVELAVAKQAIDTVHALFAGHSKADCVLLDQVALGHALPSASLPLLQALPEMVPAVDVSAPRTEQHVTPFHARGPPTRLAHIA